MEPNKITKKEFKPNFWFTTKGITLFGIFLAAYLSTLFHLTNRLNEIFAIESKYREHYSELKLDSIKLSKPKLLLNPSTGKLTLFGVGFWVKIKNNSKDVCYILAKFTNDIPTLRPVLRQKVIEQDTTRIEFFLDSTFSDYVIYPSEAKWFYVESELTGNASQEQSYLHTMFIYSNAVGGYYDMYLIQEMKYKFVDNTPLEERLDSTKQIRQIILPDLVDFTENIQQIRPYCYSLSEMEFLDKIYLKQFSKE
ncbi:MAG: hypothetical protein J0M37_12170 [Ignavibacteria bacterium]|nr:hypothetical protein [Ignavibacteria bacterium]